MHHTLLEFGARENIDIIILGQYYPHGWHMLLSSAFALVQNPYHVVCQEELIVASIIQYGRGSRARSCRRA